ncbi:MAG TPA: hypothetical protein VHU88_07375 [Sporichthyaceae bacterium]|jgi:acetyl-CoA C-acetyltransferase|nr:hypothetical protein [Sporichthyaceae bacterium]
MDMAQPVAVTGVATLRGPADAGIGPEPIALLAAAAHAAAADSGEPGLLSALDGISVVQQLTWQYDDLAGRLADRLGVKPAWAEVGPVGGDTPLTLIAAAAERISSGASRVELVCTAEALASLRQAAVTKVEPGWSRNPGGVFQVPDDWRGTERMRRLGIDWPVRVYPLFENALRARLGQSFAVAQGWTGRIYSRFTEVADEVAAAWNPGRLEPEEILTPSPANRMVCWPYPLRVNSLLAVDQAAAVLLTAPDVLPGGVYLLGVACGADSRDVLDRPDLSRSAGLQRVFDTVLKETATTVEDLTALDLYSCFPVVPKLAALALRISDDRPLTVTGGMNAFGGPGNGYSLHAVARAVEVLRSRGGRALIHANGEYLTKHAAAVLGGSVVPPQFSRLSAPEPGPAWHDGAAESLTVETYTAEFSRGGIPEHGWVIGRTNGGARVAGTVGDVATLRELTDPENEPIGRCGRLVETDSTVPEFWFDGTRTRRS